MYLPVFLLTDMQKASSTVASGSRLNFGHAIGIDIPQVLASQLRHGDGTAVVQAHAPPRLLHEAEADAVVVVRLAGLL